MKASEVNVPREALLPTIVLGLCLCLYFRPENFPDKVDPLRS